MKSYLFALPALFSLAILSGCADSGTDAKLPVAGSSQDKGPAHQGEAAHAAYAFDGGRPAVADLAALGRRMFFDASLSASGTISCASCHDPRHAYGPPNDLSVQMGGKDANAAGLRAVPSLRYVQNVPPFTEHFFDNDGDDSKDQGVVGGHDWDGRANSAHEQAAGPLLSPYEMGNADASEVGAKLRHADYAGEMHRVFGDDVFDKPENAFRAATMALEVFQETPAEFYPYSSKYDAYLRGQVKLTQQESRGLALFNDPAKGNCAACHPSAVTAAGFPQFTDYGFVALGVPRNRRLPANAVPEHHDLGLCGPLRTDLGERPAYCGLFRTPSLRNVATRHAFFHNGVFHTLTEVLQFYAQRDSNPRRWYAKGRDGSVEKFDDLPPQYQANVNQDPPFGRQPGARPALTDKEIADIIAFLNTLTDGYESARQVPVSSGTQGS